MKVIEHTTDYRYRAEYTYQADEGEVITNEQLEDRLGPFGGYINYNFGNKAKITVYID